MTHFFHKEGGNFMEIVTRRVKSLLKRTDDTENLDQFDLFMLNVLTSFLTTNLSEEQTKIVAALLQKEGYIA
jgi:hypothetical protein